MPGRVVGLGLLLLGGLVLLVAVVWPEALVPATSWFLGLGAASALVGYLLVLRSREQEGCLHQQLMGHLAPDDPLRTVTAPTARPATTPQAFSSEPAGLPVPLPPELPECPLDHAGRPAMLAQTTTSRAKDGRMRLYLALGLLALLAAGLLAIVLQQFHQAFVLALAGASLLNMARRGEVTLWIGPVGRVELGKPLGRFQGQLHLGQESGPAVCQVHERGLAFHAKLQDNGHGGIVLQFLGHGKQCYGCLPFYALDSYKTSGRLGGGRLTLEFIDADGDPCAFSFTGKETPALTGLLAEAVTRQRNAG